LGKWKKEIGRCNDGKITTEIEPQQLRFGGAIIWCRGCKFNLWNKINLMA